MFGAMVGDIAPTGYVVRALPSFAIGAYALARLYSVAHAPALTPEPLVEAPSSDVTGEQEDVQEDQACTQQEAQQEQTQAPASLQSEIQEESPTINQEEL